MKNKQLILFGGSFDPIHNGHIQAVEILQKNFPHALIIVMPSQNRLKDKGTLPIEKRIEFTKIAYNLMKNVIVVDWTLHWDTSSTFEVVEKIKKDLFPEYDVLISAGEDILPTISKWKHFDKLKYMNWVFFKRNNGETLLKHRNDTYLSDLILNATILTDNHLQISSTELRGNIHLFETFIPKSVQSLIKPYFL